MPVANVPYLFALTAGYFSQIGDKLARIADEKFSVPGRQAPGPAVNNISDLLKYNRSGVAMTHKLVANATHFNIVDHDLENNMREYVKECVFWDLAIGKYSMNDLKTTADIWEQVTRRPSPHGGLFYRHKLANNSIKTEWLTCQGAAAKLKQDFPNEISKLKV